MFLLNLAASIEYADGGAQIPPSSKLCGKLIVIIPQHVMSPLDCKFMAEVDTHKSMLVHKPSNGCINVVQRVLVDTKIP